MSGFGTFAFFLMLMLIGHICPAFTTVIRDEPSYTREDSDSFANQLMWMGQDDGQ